MSEMPSAAIMASPYISPQAPVQRLECQSAWDALTTKEKFYVYHLSKACWQGGVTSFFQRSYESGGLLLLIQALFSVNDLETRAKDAGVADEDWVQFLAYAAGVLSETGNFLSFGDTKFIPELQREKFNLIVAVSGNTTASRVWVQIQDVVYNSETGNHLEFPEKNGATSYYSPNVSRADAEFVKGALIAKGLNELHWNSRLFKTRDGFEVRIASCRGEFLEECQEFVHEDKLIRIVNGDFGLQMERLVAAISRALPYCANQTQERMLASYLKHFTTGDINLHKESQRFWIKDLQPVVEMNIGFIENYADPLNVRSEFEGFVSIVNKPVSAKYAVLVQRSMELISKLPWGKTFEKDTFMPPDFTSLEVVTFATGGIPIGINIPNYDEIRQLEGFKNVSLGNSYSKTSSSDLPFLTQPDVELITSSVDSSLKVSVSLHELLGHGSGKLLSKSKDGTANFDTEAVNPATGQKIDSWYCEGETWASKFASLSNAYEECRAETVATYLSLFDEPFEIFGLEEKEQARRALWMNMAYSGLKALLYYNPEAKMWGQAHSSARWVIFNVMREAGVVTLDFVGEDDMLLKMNYDLLQTTGKQAIGEFLIKLHCFKSTADLARGEAFYGHYNQVDETGLRMRAIVVSKRKPRRLNVTANVVLEGGVPVLKQYPEDFKGIIQSFQDRFPAEDTELLECWEAEYKLMRSLRT